MFIRRDAQITAQTRRHTACNLQNSLNKTTSIQHNDPAYYPFGTGFVVIIAKSRGTSWRSARFPVECRPLTELVG
ncbi:hypothetical protein BrE312_2358 [Brenneria sp. EniD312]|nr:hypothetical protein BrE312_2358 [Brenneria sp. EniD312]